MDTASACNFSSSAAGEELHCSGGQFCLLRWEAKPDRLAGDQPVAGGPCSGKGYPSRAAGNLGCFSFKCLISLGYFFGLGLLDVGNKFCCVCLCLRLSLSHLFVFLYHRFLFLRCVICFCLGVQLLVGSSTPVTFKFAHQHPSLTMTYNLGKFYF